MKKYLSLICLSLLFFSCAEEKKKEEASSESGQTSKIDRKAVITRNNVQVNQLDTLASLSVGNGSFAFTVDGTGLQTFPDMFQYGVPLGTESEWGWDSFPNSGDYKFEETLEDYDQYGRKVSYSVQKKGERARKAVDFFRSNPHRVQLGNLGFDLLNKNGEKVQPEDITDIEQELNVWTGVITSTFKLEGIPVEVKTLCHQEEDIIGVEVNSELIENEQLKIRLRLPYPTGGWTDLGTKWEAENLDYSSEISANEKNHAVVTRQMDSLKYDIGFNWKGEAKFNKKENQYFELIPQQNKFSFTCQFTNKTINKETDFASVEKSSKSGWASFWKSGGIVDFSECTDARAPELERRVVLSQYLTKLQCTGEIPPQETGLTYNSWYGKPHLEMHWWHGVHFPLWGRPELLEESLPWYNRVFKKAKHIAERQGFKGARWQKMTDPYGDEGPSSVGAFLLWQQPHFITYAELMYRADSTSATLEKYKERVFATADFMASFAHLNEEGTYDLGPGVIPAQERFPKMETFNPTYELAYWNWALTTALEWKERLGEEQPAAWKKVAENLSPLPVQEDYYLATENATDSYTNPEYLTDHPSVLGTYGMLPITPMLDKEIMNNTFNKVWDIWTWEDTWGWDFPMTAMAAARLGKPEKAVDALFMDVQTNTYLKNGHNYQEERLTLYMPGNGGLLTAVAMMCAGWDETNEKNPGFPNNGKWNVKWEGLKKMP